MATRSGLVENQDYTVEDLILRISGKKLTVVSLTPAGKKRLEEIKSQIFPPDAPKQNVPLGFNITIHDINQESIFSMDGLFARAVIRSRTDGYMCTLFDDFPKLKQESFQARVLNVNADAQTVRLQFDHWPSEFYSYRYTTQNPNISLVSQPLTIGPECVVSFRSLQKGAVSENPVRWLRNAVRRNLLVR